MIENNTSTEFQITFGGENHIRIETLTDCLEQYRQILYKINEQLGYSENDFFVEVFSPEVGSFKIKLRPKYENLLLNTITGVIAGTLSGLLLLWVDKFDKKFSIEDVQKIIKILDSEEKKEIVKNVYNLYQRRDIKQNINYTFEKISQDKNIQSLEIKQDKVEIINIPKSDFGMYIKDDIEIFDEDTMDISEEKIDKEEVSLIIKTVNFEGNAKWAFIWRGYPIKASVKDDKFKQKMDNEAFKRGDILKVILQKSSSFSSDLNTYIVDENSYEIIEVLDHQSKVDNNYKLDLQ